MFAFEGEDALIIDELPENASVSEVLAIMDEVHDECVAAVMAQGDLGSFATSARSWTMDREPRPRSGLPRDGA